jgi:uncharacterized protein (DUF1919 family)
MKVENGVSNVISKKTIAQNSGLKFQKPFQNLYIEEQVHVSKVF